jgi:hypothetical protein
MVADDYRQQMVRALLEAKQRTLNQLGFVGDAPMTTKLPLALLSPKRLPGRRTFQNIRLFQGLTCFALNSPGMMKSRLDVDHHKSACLTTTGYTMTLIRSHGGGAAMWLKRVAGTLRGARAGPRVVRHWRGLFSTRISDPER